ncbi:universal stress protein Sll1388-like [Gigantopelta aegis]|uniref:universal stress protein Sll1388-like n=1 Tax=Gigantopelta aegis TaxID=1735272 RepID=UPI001B88AA7D|nr:universal stress protein Sll1388-like [Gigantopelta aegis]
MANNVHTVTPKRVVIAMDGSEYSQKAFEWYVKNLHTTNDEYEPILAYCPEFGHVFGPFMTGDTNAVSEKLRKEEEEVQAVLQSLQATLDQSGVIGRVVRLTGSPGDAICKLAEDEDADCIVTGTRGHGKLRRTILGSVSQYVIHHAKVPVFVCRDRHK